MWGDDSFCLPQAAKILNPALSRRKVKKILTWTAVFATLNIMTVSQFDHKNTNTKEKFIRLLQPEQFLRTNHELTDPVPSYLTSRSSSKVNNTQLIRKFRFFLHSPIWYIFFNFFFFQDDKKWTLTNSFGLVHMNNAEKITFVGQREDKGSKIRTYVTVFGSHYSISLLIFYWVL